VLTQYFAYVENHVMGKAKIKYTISKCTVYVNVYVKFLAMIT